MDQPISRVAEKTILDIPVDVLLEERAGGFAIRGRVWNLFCIAAHNSQNEGKQRRQPTYFLIESCCLLLPSLPHEANLELCGHRGKSRLSQLILPM
jgi:hypothetical protein